MTRLSYLSFIILMALIFSLSPFAIDMYLPALPNMSQHFSTSIDFMEGTVAIFLLGFALSQLILGTLADSVNKQKLLTVGLIGFSLSSIAIALVDSPTYLLIFRFLQAFAGGSAVVVFGLIRERFNDRQSAQVISYIMAAVVIAPMIAPIIGGQVLTHFNWQAIFYVLAGIALLNVVLQFVLFRNEKIVVNVQKKPLDLKNILSGYAQILKSKQTLSFIFAGGFAFAGLFAFVAGSPFVYIEFFNVPPDQYGYYVALNAVAMIVANLLNAKVLADVVAIKKIKVGAVIILIAGIYLIVSAVLHLNIWFIVVGVVVYMFALGLISSNAIAGALSSKPELAGLISGISGVLQFGLGALASSIVSISVSSDAITMAAVMFVCSILSFVFALLLQQVTK
ncbi:MAG: Bcr/CflA family multidrug efflux MFS transporter [Saccharospirillaceae bacterium]|nr:Bcr/CflA family multidrug efflux MFS transporter [Pseudomonadales bacterium]NRB80595.1 Bcr/CflA family multidrug efflux MFS transporter [Saccharospirillaceae bacterium]